MVIRCGCGRTGRRRAVGWDEGPQEARGSAEPAVGREGRAHQEARGNGEGKAHRKVYAGWEKQEAGRCGCGRKAMHTWPNIPGHWLT